MFLKDKVEKLSKHVYFIQGLEKGRYPYSHSLLIKNDKSCLIDSGVGLETLMRIKDDVDTVLYSHWHEDHIAFNNLFHRKYIHHLDKPAVEDSNIFCGRYPFSSENCDILIKFFNLSFTKDSFDTFEDEDIFECGDTVVRVLYTPGHTIGHSSFLIDDNIKILFLSDIDLSDFGPWYGGLDSDLIQFIDSIKLVESIVRKNDIRIVISSHLGVFRDMEEVLERLEKYLEKIFERERMIREYIRNGYDLDEMIGKGIIYKDISKEREYRYHAEKIMIKQHISRIYHSK